MHKSLCLNVEFLPNSSWFHSLPSPNSCSSGHPPRQHLILYQITLVLWIQVIFIWRDLSNFKSGSATSHSFKNHILSTSYGAGTVLNTGYTASKIKYPPSRNLHFRADNIQGGHMVLSAMEKNKAGKNRRMQDKSRRWSQWNAPLAEYTV